MEKLIRFYYNSAIEDGNFKGSYLKFRSEVYNNLPDVAFWFDEQEESIREDLNEMLSTFDLHEKVARCLQHILDPKTD